MITEKTVTLHLSEGQLEKLNYLMNETLPCAGWNPDLPDYEQKVLEHCFIVGLYHIRVDWPEEDTEEGEEYDD